MKYKGIIFDLDGVICHTDKYHYLAWKSIADDLGIFFDETINNRLRGVSRMESLDIILEGYTKDLSVEEKVQLAEKKNAYYRELLNEITTGDLSEEVKYTLDYQRSQGLKLAIGSSSKNATFILEKLGLGDYFDGISDGNNLNESKPNPEVFFIAASRIGLNPSDCLVVEDANAGVEAAFRGGFDCAGIGEAAMDLRTTYPIATFSDLNLIE